MMYCGPPDCTIDMSPNATDIDITSWHILQTEDSTLDILNVSGEYIGDSFLGRQSAVSINDNSLKVLLIITILVKIIPGSLCLFACIVSSVTIRFEPLFFCDPHIEHLENISLLFSCHGF